jgi:CxxC motif-containing protein (DUF1111 family)
MKTKKIFNNSVLTITLAIFSYGCNPAKEATAPLINNITADSDAADNAKALLAGSGTVFDDSDEAFGHPNPKLSFENKAKFLVGDSLFDQKWLVAPSATTGRDGLGPFFNAQSCAACHFSDGRGRPPKDDEKMESLLLRVSVPGKSEHNEPVGSHIYGGQLQGSSIPGFKPEIDVKITYEDIKGQFSDGENYTLKKPVYNITPNYGPLETGYMISPRVANQMGGLGLLEDIPENDIIARADPDDKDNDGISGRPNYVWDVENKKIAMGRFGWKANQPSLRQQVAGAFSGDIGITSSIFPDEGFTDSELKSFKKADTGSGGNPELTDKNLERVTLYSGNLAVAARRNLKDPDVISGERLFSQLSCNKCHVAGIQSQGETIHPYTDLLLHDMGENLSDNRPDFLADGKEWRTPPLWGIGLFSTVNGHSNYMHDGRANNLKEAVLWHGGEAAKSTEQFKNLSKNERNALIKFLDSL